MSSASLQMPGELSISPSLWQTGCSGSAVIAAILAIMWKSHMFYSTYIFHPCHHGHSLSRVTMWEYEWLKRDNANSWSSSGPWEHSLKWMLRDKDMRHNSLSGLFNLVTPCFQFKSSSFQVADQSASLLDYQNLAYTSFISFSRQNPYLSLLGDFPLNTIFIGVGGTHWGSNMVTVHFSLM